MGSVCSQTRRQCVFRDREDGNVVPPTVFLVDHDAAVREQARRAFPAYQLTVEAFGDWSEFLRAFSPPRPGCLVVDWVLHDDSGPALLDRIGDSGVTLPVIVFTATADAADVVQAFQWGVFDFFEKPAVSGKLIESVRNALAWDTSRRCLQWQLAEIERRRSRLNNHELELLGWLLAGETEKAIARRLDATVTHVTRLQSALFEKMSVSSLAELVDMEAFRQKLIELINSPRKRIRFDQPHPDVSQLPACPLWLKQVPSRDEFSAARRAAVKGEDDDEQPGDIPIA